MLPESPYCRPLFLPEIQIYGNKEVGPKIASLCPSLIRTHGFCGDLIAIIMPASVQAALFVYVCVFRHVCVAAHPILWIRQILEANNGALCLRQDYTLPTELTPW